MISTDSCGISRSKTPAISQRIISSTLNAIQQLLPQDKIHQLCAEAQYTRRDRILPPAVTVLHMLLAAHLLVPFIQASVRIRGKRQVIWLVTSLLNAKAYPAAEIVQLYGRRWRIETLFEQLKIRLSADVLRSHSPDGIRKEFAARCIASNLVHSVILEAASVRHVDPMWTSFTHAVRAILIFSPALACEPVVRLPSIYRAMISEITHHLVPERSGRIEPRAVRREHKHYPSLKETPVQWRQHHAA